MIKVLVADDESIVREGFTYYICWKDFGCELVACSENGEDALDAFKATQPDIVITDIQMPKMNGFELTRAIQKLNTSTIVIFLSAYSEFEYAQTALKLGIFDYILKPLDIDVFKATILKAVEFRKTQLKKLNTGFSLDKEDLKDYSNNFCPMIKKDEHLLLQAVQLNDEASTITAFNNLWKTIEGNNYSIDYIKRWIFEFTVVLSRSSLFISQNLEALYGGHDPITELSALSNNAEIYSWMTDTLISICSFIKDNSFNNKIVTEALKIIFDNFQDKNLSLNYVSKRLFISPNYLSTLFKEEVGENFSDYLIDYRIKKAKALLKDVSIKIYEVADRVGYSDPHYFSKFFKANTGITPKEYRDKALV
jgi:two-component system response regulator YesN